MKTIKAYLKNLEKELQGIKDVLSIIDELRIHLYEEFEDYSKENSNRLSKELLEENYVNSLERIEDVSKSFRIKGVDETKTEVEIFRFRKYWLARLIIAYTISLVFSWIYLTIYNYSITTFSSPLQPPSNLDFVSTNLVTYIFWPLHFDSYPMGSGINPANIRIATITTILFIILILLKVERIFKRFRCKKSQMQNKDSNLYLDIEKKIVIRWFGAYFIIACFVFWKNSFLMTKSVYSLMSNLILSVSWPLYFIDQLDLLIFILTIKSDFNVVQSYEFFLVPLYETIMLQLLTIVLFILMIYLKWERILPIIKNKIRKSNIYNSVNFTKVRNIQIDKKRLYTYSIFILGLIYLFISVSWLFDDEYEPHQNLITWIINLDSSTIMVLITIGGFIYLTSTLFLLVKMKNFHFFLLGKYLFFLGTILIISVFTLLLFSFWDITGLILLLISLIPLFIHLRYSSELNSEI